MYQIEKDVPYQQTIAKCKYPELRRIAYQMDAGDSVVVPNEKECTALQMYIQRRIHTRADCFAVDEGAQITRRKRVADEMGNTIGYRVWKLV